MVSVDGVKFISEKEFDDAVVKVLDKFSDNAIEHDPMKGLLVTLGLTVEMSKLRCELFGDDEEDK